MPPSFFLDNVKGRARKKNQDFLVFSDATILDAVKGVERTMHPVYKSGRKRDTPANHPVVDRSNGFPFQDESTEGRIPGA
jgi:hypothetical protein